MAILSVKESDFENIATAANNAFDSGDEDLANALDTIARKINAALCRDNSLHIDHLCSGSKKLSWSDMPSCLRHNILNSIKETK